VSTQELAEMYEKYSNNDGHGCSYSTGKDMSEIFVRGKSAKSIFNDSVNLCAPKKPSLSLPVSYDKDVTSENSVTQNDCSSTLDKSSSKTTNIEFKSGFVLPISTSCEANKKIISNTSVSKRNDTVRIRGPQNTLYRGDSDYDVHKQLNFSALNIRRGKKSTSDHSTSSPTNPLSNQITHTDIVLSKNIASRAMMRSFVTDFSLQDAFLDKVRMVFTSALDYVTLQRKMQHLPKYKNFIELLTLDPAFLSQQSNESCDFIKISRQIIRREQLRCMSAEHYKKVKDIKDVGFLDCNFTQQANGLKAAKWPEWFFTCVNPKDNTVHLSIIILAQFELSLQSYFEQNALRIDEAQNKDELSDITHLKPSDKIARKSRSEGEESFSNEEIKIREEVPKHGDLSILNHKDTFGLSNNTVRNPPPEKDTAENDLIKRDFSWNSCAFTSFPIQRQETLNKSMSLLRFWDSINAKKIMKSSVISAVQCLFDSSIDKSTLSTFLPVDLFLVPFNYFQNTSFSVDLAKKISNGNERNMKNNGEYENHLSLWEYIIDAGLLHTKEDLKSFIAQEKKLELPGYDRILNSECNLTFENKDEFWDLCQKSNTTTKKRAKKKKKKKRKTATLDGNPQSTKQSTSNQNSAQNNTSKILNKGQTANQISNSVNSTTNDEGDKNCESHINEGVVMKSQNSTSTKKPNSTLSTLSTVSGSCVVVGGRVEDDEEDNDDTWETVEHKGGRNSSKKKKSNIVANSRHLEKSDSVQSSCGSLLRNRHKGKTKLCRQRTTHKRIVKDLLNSILDAVDDEINRRRREVSKSHANERRRVNEERKKRFNNSQYFSSFSSNETNLPAQNSRAASLKNLATVSPHNQPATKLISIQSSLGSISKGFGSCKEKKYVGLHNSFSKQKETTNLHRKKIVSLSSVDQSTALTVPETLSGVSASGTQSTSNTYDIDREENHLKCSEVKKNCIINDSKQKPQHDKECVVTHSHETSCVSSSSGENEEPGDLGRNSSPSNGAPPLETLLGPGNTNSATSSVASSLEAPHASRHRPRFHDSSYVENDVGYHLLNICARLSRDLNIFMRRRASALNIRRQERGALLVALQDTIKSIWTNHCRVEMYGSCATQLDLPSSDLDVVICGLDHGLETNCTATHTSDHNSKEEKLSQSGNEMQHSLSEKYREETDKDSSSQSMDDGNQIIPDCHQNTFNHYQFYPPLSHNGSRVVRLAAELEQQPWAVQVKAIPTASVPVIKILADPSKLPGAVTGVNWIIHEQHMVAANVTGISATRSMLTESANDTDSSSSSSTKDFSSSGNALPAVNKGRDSSIVGLSSQPPQHYHASLPPWRGADVMNGLISVDITFEGPEHGGIGSTAFSTQVVQEACDETGLLPESTPAVQVIMLIKELLAQRRLNEPFSGGLSSYAIILLVVAVIKERRAIREEMEREERQRMAVSSGNTSNNVSVCNGIKVKQELSVEMSCQEDCVDKNFKELLPWSNKSKTEKKACKAWTSSSESISISSNSNHELSCNISSKAADKSFSWASVAKRKISAKTNPNLTQTNRTCNQIESVNAMYEQQYDGNEHDVNPISVLEKKDFQKAAESDAYVSQKVKVTGSSRSQDMKEASSPLFPQGSNDVLEVLCSGEPTAGKLLMHFFLFYGKQFDAQTTCVDVSGTHHPDNDKSQSDHYPRSSFIPRKSVGSYDPITGVFTVDPILVYDPLEGSETNNVAKSCYAWSSIKWVFEQCHNTLSGVVERGAGTTGTRKHRKESKNFVCQNQPEIVKNSTEVPHRTNSENDSQHVSSDDLSPLLELLLSF